MPMLKQRTKRSSVDVVRKTGSGNDAIKKDSTALNRCGHIGAQ
jgi:hypothetical protein